MVQRKVGIGAVLALLLVSVATWATDVIPFTSASSIFAYIKSLYIVAEGGVHYVILDGERSITKAGTPEVTLQTNTRVNGYLALDTTAGNAKDLLALLMMADGMDWRVRLKVSSTVINGYNVVSYSLAPSQE